MVQRIPNLRLSCSRAEKVEGNCFRNIWRKNWKVMIKQWLYNALFGYETNKKLYTI